jgi:hypothetical protein
MDKGWISIYRSLQEHWIWSDPQKLRWWITILFNVNHTDSKILLGNTLFEIRRGQSAKSLRTWASLFETTPKTVSSFFELLSKDGMITIEVIGKGKQSTTLITIEKYTEYQGDNKRKEPQKLPRKRLHEQPTNNNTNNKENIIYTHKNTSLSADHKVITGNLFYIGTKLFPYPVSKYVLSELQIHTSMFMPTVKPLTIEQVLNEMDIRYSGSQFTNHTHVIRAFDKTAKDLLAGKNKKPFNNEVVTVAAQPVPFKHE